MTLIARIRPLLTVDYSQFEGQGLSTLPTEIDIKRGSESYVFYWRYAEIWEGVDLKTFQWRPMASTPIVDY